MRNDGASQEQALLNDIDHAARKLKEIFPDASVRVWRYVDSQKALFGLTSVDPIAPQDGGETKFLDFVAFLRNPESLQEHAAKCIGPISNNADGTHPLWDVVPEYGKLPKKCRQPFMESILVVDRQARVLNIDDDLLGVVCIDAPFDEYATHPRHDEIDEQIELILNALRTYSLLLFRGGFRKAQRFLVDERESRDKAIRLDGLSEDLRRLIDALDGHPSTVSIYVRRVVDELDRVVPLIAGAGDFHQVLHDVDELLESEYRKDMFSYHAQIQLAKETGLEPVLFPGSGDSKHFRQYLQWLLEAQASLLKAVVDPALQARLQSVTDNVIWNGSFGVFPIRWTSEGPGGREQLVALLCVAATNQRHFFTWAHRLVLERFCQSIGRQHSEHIAPLLNRVTERAHKELIGSLETLEQLVSKPSPLIRPIKHERQCFAFVMSVDIRKSTDIMVKMVPAFADLYAKVLIDLCDWMRDAVKEEYGIFDKFTGDGILAFFPEFFEGGRKDAACRVLRAAERCHEAFRTAYPELWPALNAVPAPSEGCEKAGRAGLGIGIDFGQVRLVNVGTELTVIGAPVVYACRLASAAAGYTTLLNYPGYHALMLSGMLDLIECAQVAVPIKNDEILAYRVSRKREIPAPEWTLKGRDSRAQTWGDDWLFTGARR